MSRWEIVTASAGDLERVRPLLEGAAQKPFRYLAGRGEADLAAFWLHELAALAQDGAGEVLVAEAGGRALGLAASAPLPWDSQVLERRMAAIRCLVVDPAAPGRRDLGAALLRRAEAGARERAAEFLLCKAGADDPLLIHLLEDHGFRLMDTLLDYVFDFRQTPLSAIPRPPLPAGFALRSAAAADEEALAGVARAAFGEHFGRFHADERISREQATRVYEEWIRSCCRGYGDWILAAEKEGRLAGYAVWKRPSAAEQRYGLNVGHYSIGAVHPDFAGCGLFVALTYEGMRALESAAGVLEGPTHLNNRAVQRGYARLHWRVAGARHSFHKWLDRGA